MRSPVTATKLTKGWCQPRNRHPRVSLRNEQLHSQTFHRRRNWYSQQTQRKAQHDESKLISDHRKANKDADITLKSYFGKDFQAQ